MKCPELQESLALYADGSLPAEETPGIEEHLKECAFCRGELETLQEALGFIGKLEAPPVPEGLHLHIMTGIREERKRKHQAGKLSWFGAPKFLATAAAFLLLFFAGGNYYLATQMLPGSAMLRSQAEYGQDETLDMAGKDTVSVDSEEIPPMDGEAPAPEEALPQRSWRQPAAVRNIAAYNALLFALGGGLWYYYRRGKSPRETGD